jgi:hypothetical protein
MHEIRALAQDEINNLGIERFDGYSELENRSTGMQL